jgi:hypothetical protein
VCGTSLDRSARKGLNLALGDRNAFAADAHESQHAIGLHPLYQNSGNSWICTNA